MTSRRKLRVADSVKRSLSDALLHDVSDPRLNMVAVQSVDVSPDLRQAKIYYSILDPNIEESEIDTAFAKAKGYLRNHIAQTVQLKYAPDLIFVRDTSRDVANRIDDLIRQTKEINSDPEDS